ncbi:MAG: SUMF1/EgtB/PvdO family nonheme iron enzyme [Chitinophagales bacterium]|nr:SUMF1/EgtB/PvdO family nonheme iron enzyme [Chitinophagales bacterium]
MLRGGSWNNNPENCRVANRNRNNPNNRNNNVGFRVARDNQGGYPLAGVGVVQGERPGVCKLDSLPFVLTTCQYRVANTSLGRRGWYIRIFGKNVPPSFISGF